MFAAEGFIVSVQLTSEENREFKLAKEFQHAKITN